MVIKEYESYDQNFEKNFFLPKKVMRMSKLSIAGVLSLICAFLTIGYQAISSFMRPDAVYKTLRPIDMLDKNVIDWVDNISADFIYQIADFFITTPIYIIFIVVGVILLVISSFVWR